MKLPKAKKLPSGSWRVQVMVNGARISVTAPTEKEAVAKAAAIKAQMLDAEKPAASLTVGEAIDRYIDSKDAVLSPSTIAGYRSIRAVAMRDIMGVRLSALTQERIQQSVNAMARDGKSAKYIRNAHGLLSAALAEYRPGFVPRTKLPQKKKADIHIPSGAEIETIMDAARGTRSELPILLTLWLGLRTSEILGLTWDCVEDGRIHIKQAIVRGEDGYVAKDTTKTYSGDRWLPLPAYIAELIDAQPRIDERVIHLTGAMIYKDFVTLCEKNGLPHYRFYDLRHANASVMLALGVPDKYAMERMGHATPNMLKTVYQHTMDDKTAAITAAIDEYFNSKLHTNLHTEN